MKIYWSDKMKKYAVVLTALIAIAGFSPLVGRISLSELLYSSQNEFFDMILFEIRLPRLIAAFFIGASLSVAGAAFQAIFQNPLVGPNILGVTSGAGFGAVVFILFFNEPFWFK
ncbi:iron chelate uptake ABC transporter family permease subunit [Campylobacter fetus]|uniref:iron chelate uptake ABC transporter family permease subunit n=1 Tax=Campylobacter fetus TaxID=196 RepID=UPI002029D587|nr:iron chelate uptake ABC transporter family permease subunit [Campylobacter fetus]